MPRPHWNETDLEYRYGSVPTRILSCLPAPPRALRHPKYWAALASSVPRRTHRRKAWSTPPLGYRLSTPSRQTPWSPYHDPWPPSTRPAPPPRQAGPPP